MFTSGFRATLILAAVLLVAVEVLLQARAEFRYGNSIFSSLFRQSGASHKSIFIDQGGYRTLIPGISVVAGQIEIRANSLGLRDSEKTLTHKTENIVVLGASTVYGAFARNNERTFPALLETRHRWELPRPVQTLNAGIPGNDIDAQLLLFARKLGNPHIDHLVLYPGITNLLAKACRSAPTEAATYALPAIALPKWILTYDLLLKNTVALRYRPVDETLKANVDTGIHEALFRRSLESIVREAIAHGVRNVFLVENVKAFHGGQSIEEQLERADTILYHANCFSLRSFNAAFDRFNDVMQKVAEHHPAVHFISLADAGVQSNENFADSIHFTYEGELLVADRVHKRISAILQGRDSE